MNLKEMMFLDLSMINIFINTITDEPCACLKAFMNITIQPSGKDRAHADICDGDNTGKRRG